MAGLSTNISFRDLAAATTDEFDATAGAAADDSFQYRSHAKKQWELPYQTPFITCKECNTLNFFDAHVLEATLHTPDVVVDLPRCVGCGMAMQFTVGARDEHDHVMATRLARLELKQARRRAATDLARCYRGMIGRRIARKKREARAAWLAKIKKNAAVIQRIMRGRIGRKVAHVERCLKRIKNTVRFVLWDTLSMTPLDGKKRHLFWYKRAAEEKLVYEDYRVFVDRTGNMPPLHIVEANIIEIARRIHYTETMKATDIQKVFRGTIGRMFAKELRAEYARLFSVRHSAALMLQCWWRVILAYRRVERIKLGFVPPAIMTSYKKYRAKQAAKRLEADNAFTLSAYYKQEIKQCRSAYFTGKVAYGSYGGKKLYAFSQSAYRSDTKRSASLIRDLLRRREVDEKQVQDKLAANRGHNRKVDQVLQARPKMKRFKYLEKLSTHLPKRQGKPVIDKSRIAHFTPIVSTSSFSLKH